MTDNEKNSATEMSDNEIILALEICQQCEYGECLTCPYNDIFGCNSELMKDVLGLINRQKEQIEGLIAGQETLQKALNEKIAEVEGLNKELLKSKIFKFARNPRRIYNVMDFQDGEILRFYDYPDKPNAVSQGYYFFQGKEDIRLININEVKELSCNEIKSEAVKEFAERLKEKKCHYTETEDTFDFDGVTVEDIDNLVKEMVGDEE